ncbi:hypothetical protein [Bradyrhizobium tropiciagri]|nr:hypothetical protein [Bradyrhizobium tropiciagri]
MPDTDDRLIIGTMSMLFDGITIMLVMIIDIPIIGIVECRP